MVTALRLLFAGFLAASLSPCRAHAASAVTIWPVNPVLGSTARAAALWLENNDHHNVLLQVRVFRWTQDSTGDQYADQTDIVASPPMASVPPGARQLIRLIRAGTTPSDAETAYRVIIDEIPTPESQQAAARSGPRIAIQLRYSVPLFVYGTHAPAGAGEPTMVTDIKARPALHWHIATRNGRHFLAVANTGPIHAQLSQATLGGRTVSAGLLGYILPGRTMEWPLTGGASGAPLQAFVNGGAKRETIPAQP
ncbi:P pilus assembly protein PapD [Gluconacetobacter sacchari DSM 12717]|uniref:Molecular chaperone n=2 Tax=Gluconacetobacter sacchari TaxID=92759 RepID=A0A7W4IE16_9PROT|nr:molecular chaperone [Gluconacetobacter sacchari]MBB2161062.1 molecular chaperone [Gluconacetobacter sacchari]GBQ26396.1 P pilus assembly protein PapD [Gluconacetobacter sacchari DSM 12717]